MKNFTNLRCLLFEQCINDETKQSFHGNIRCIPISKSLSLASWNLISRRINIFKRNETKFHSPFNLSRNENRTAVKVDRLTRSKPIDR